MELVSLLYSPESKTALTDSYAVIFKNLSDNNRKRFNLHTNLTPQR